MNDDRPRRRGGALRAAVDRAAEATVALSFGATGYRLRKPTWDPGATDVDLRGHVAVVTGANSGIGFELTSALTARGARVLMVCRDPGRAEAAAASVRDDVGPLGARAGTVELVIADLAVLSEVAGAADEILRKTNRVDRLVLNAGVLLPERSTTSEGLERTFATNLLGGFLLARKLEPALRAASPSRLLHVTSGGMYSARLDLEALQGNVDPYDGLTAYAQTKRAQVILNELWAARLTGTGVVSHAMHPGWADTPGVERSLPRFHRLLKPLLRDAAQGADTLIWLATAADVASQSGKLWLDRAPRSTHKLPTTREDAEDRVALWALCEELVAPHLDPDPQRAATD